MYFFFFKQKTAYEMRISDWSSDVCSSDLKAWSDEEDERIEKRRAEQNAFLRGGHIDPAKEEAAALIEERDGIQPRGHAARVMADNPKPARRRKIVGDLRATVSQGERQIYRVADVRAAPALNLNSKTVHEPIVAVRSEEHTSDL